MINQFWKSIESQVLEDKSNTSARPTHIIITGYSGAGKCLGKGTPVLKFSGEIVSVEQIVAGDLLMGPDSKPRKVLTTTSGVSDLYKVIPIKGDPYVVNKNHILSLKFTGIYNDLLMKKGSSFINVSVEDYLKWPKTKRESAKGWRTGVDFQKQDVPLDPYILGVWLGDGTSECPSITSADFEIADAIYNYAEKNGLFVKVYQDSENKAKDYRISSQNGSGGRPNNIFLNVLRMLGVYGNKHIPSIYLANDRDTRLQILAGLLDTDGYYGGGYFEYSSKLEKLADGVCFLARSLGLAAYKKRFVSSYKKKDGSYFKGIQWRICISGELSIIPTKIERKKCRVRNQIKRISVTGIKVESIGIGEYYGFELDGDGLFLLGDFTVTHNSTLAKLLSGLINLPVAKVDDDPLWSQSENIVDGPDCFNQGTEGQEEYERLLRKLSRSALDKNKTHILEGCQFLASPNKWRGHKVIVLDGDENTIVSQRLKRDKNDGKLNKDGKQAREDKARKLYRGLKPYVEEAKKHPNVEVIKPSEIKEFLQRFRIDPKKIEKALVDYGIKKLDGNDIISKLQKTCQSFKNIPNLGPDYQKLYWNPICKIAWWESFDGDDSDAVSEVIFRLEKVQGVKEVKCESESGPPRNEEGWICIWPKSKYEKIKVKSLSVKSSPFLRFSKSFGWLTKDNSKEPIVLDKPEVVTTRPIEKVNVEEPNAEIPKAPTEVNNQPSAEGTTEQPKKTKKPAKPKKVSTVPVSPFVAESGKKTKIEKPKKVTAKPPQKVDLAKIKDEYIGSGNQLKEGFDEDVRDLGLSKEEAENLWEKVKTAFSDKIDEQKDSENSEEIVDNAYANVAEILESELTKLERKNKNERQGTAKEEGIRGEGNPSDVGRFVGFGNDVGGSGRGSSVGSVETSRTGGEEGRKVKTEIFTPRAHLLPKVNLEVVPKIRSVDAKGRPTLDDGQKEGIARGIEGLVKHKAFLNSSGTGVGKSRQQLVVGQWGLDNDMVVLCLSPNAVINPDYDKGTFLGSFKDDSEATGISMTLTKGDEELKEGTINIGTYDNLEKFVELVNKARAKGKKVLTLLDESHKIKNIQKAGAAANLTPEELKELEEQKKEEGGKIRSKVSVYGRQLLDASEMVYFASATPVDQPIHLGYLERLHVFGDRTPGEIFNELGLIKKPKSKKGKKGQTGPSVAYIDMGGGLVVDPDVGIIEFKRRLSGLFDALTKEGMMYKQEIALNDVDILIEKVPLDKKVIEEINLVEKTLVGSSQEIYDLSNKLDGETQKHARLSRKYWELKEKDKQHAKMEKMGVGISDEQLEQHNKEKQEVETELNQSSTEKTRLDTQLQALKTQRGNKRTPKKAQVLMAQRKVQEPYKIDLVSELAKKELGSNRKVVIFAARAATETELESEEGEVVLTSEATMPKLKKALVELGIKEGRIAELHGGVSKGIRSTSASRFQSGDADVIIGTVESGGTGINLDDTTGEAPRTMIVITPPLSGVDLVQMIGRIKRKNTASNCKVIFVFADTKVDDWNRGITAKKVTTMGASVGGKIGDIKIGKDQDPEYADVNLFEEVTKDPYIWRNLVKLLTLNYPKKILVKRIKSLNLPKVKRSPFWKVKYAAIQATRRKLTPIPKNPRGENNTISLLVDPREISNKSTGFTNLPRNVYEQSSQGSADENMENILEDHRSPTNPSIGKDPTRKDAIKYGLVSQKVEVKGRNPNEHGNVFGGDVIPEIPYQPFDPYNTTFYEHPKREVKDLAEDKYGSFLPDDGFNEHEIHKLEETYPNSRRQIPSAEKGIENKYNFPNDLENRNYQEWQATQRRIQDRSRNHLDEEYKTKSIKDENGHSYGAVIYTLPDKIRKQITDWSLENIPSYHLDEGGYEYVPHVTCVYGFDENSHNFETLRVILARFGPIPLTLGKFGLFEGGKDGDVLIIHIDSPKLHELNSEIKKSIDCGGNKHKSFNPHVTVAYLDKQYSWIYKGKLGIKSISGYKTKDLEGTEVSQPSQTIQVEEPQELSTTATTTGRRRQSSSPQAPRVSQPRSTFSTMTITPPSTTKSPQTPSQKESTAQQSKPKKEVKPEVEKGKKIAEEALKHAKEQGIFTEHQLGVMGREVEATFVSNYENRLSLGDSPEKAYEDARNFALSELGTVGNTLKEQEHRWGDKPKQSTKKPVQEVEKPTGIKLEKKLDNPKALAYVEELFGKNVDLDTLGAIASAPSGTRIELEKRSWILHKPDEHRLSISYDNKEQGIHADRSIQTDEEGNLVCNNQMFSIDDDSPYKGMGTALFVSQVKTLQGLGIKKIICRAIGYHGGDYNGYYTWPTLGYDGTIQEPYFDALPQELQDQLGDKRKILDLYELPGGREAWFKYGGEIFDATFDLSDGSRSMKILTKYLEERKQNG